MHVTCSDALGVPGAWYCFECTCKMQAAIIEHGGEDGRKFRNMFRPKIPEIETLLKFNWRKVLKDGTIDSIALAHKNRGHGWHCCDGCRARARRPRVCE